MELTEEQLRALEALESMDDFARMDTGVDPIGPYKVLREFIEAPLAPPASEQKPVASSDLDVLRRISERGLKLAQANGPAFIDLFQHLIDEIARQPDYKAQRDALLKSLEEALECGEDGDWQSARRVLVSAIASVKGGAE